jgi:hypothetical protein
MRLVTIFAILGLILSALAAFWYWQIMQVAAALAWASGGPNTNRQSWIAIGVFVFGLAISLTCLVIYFVAKDPDA